MTNITSRSGALHLSHIIIDDYWNRTFIYIYVGLYFKALRVLATFHLICAKAKESIILKRFRSSIGAVEYNIRRIGCFLRVRFFFIKRIVHGSLYVASPVASPVASLLRCSRYLYLRVPRISLSSFSLFFLLSEKYRLVATMICRRLLSDWNAHSNELSDVEQYSYRS